MAVIKVKPTSPGRRAVVKVVASAPVQGPARSVAARAADAERRPQQQRPHHDAPQGRRPQAPLPRRRLRAQQGRRSRPRSSASSTTRTARAHIALVVYADGERRYVIAPRGLEVGSTIVSGAEAPIKAGNTLPIRNIPVGSIIHCIEMLPGKGAQIARSAGTPCTLLAREGTYAQVRLRSGEVRKIHIDCRATIGEVVERRAQPAPLRQGRREALEGHPPDGARRRDEPGRPPARRRRRPHRRGPGAGVAVEHADQGLPHAQQQAHADDDRRAPQEVRR